MAGTIAADTLTHSTAGSLTTDYVVNGSAKVWINHDKNPENTNDSFNVSSVTDVGIGVSTYNLTNSMSNANYTALISAGGGMSFATGKLFGSNGTNGVTAPTSSAFNQVTGYATNSGNVTDADYNTAAVFGDLA